MPQPPYTPDLAPTDFFLFAKTEDTDERRFATIEEIKENSKQELLGYQKNGFQNCFGDWKKRWHKYTLF